MTIHPNELLEQLLAAKRQRHTRSCNKRRRSWKQLYAELNGTWIR
jgi:hypothetical protein